MKLVWGVIPAPFYKKMEMKDNNYILLFGWMMNKAELKGNELLVFGIIFGFSQDGKSLFTGGLRYLCEVLSVSRPTVINAIKKLIKSDLITKEVNDVNGVKFVNYRVNLKTVENFTGGKEILQGSKETLQGGSKKTLPINTTNKNKDKIKDSIPPLFEDVKNEFKNKGRLDLAEKFWFYYESNGWKVGRNKMKAWRAAVAQWVAREKKEGSNLFNIEKNKSNEW